MARPPSHEVTRLLRAVSDGEDQAVDALLPVVYDELRALAHRQRLRWSGMETLNTTALVHEAYVKLIDQDEAAWNDRTHFYRVAARAMRYILLDYARARKTQKRGGNLQRIPYVEHLLPSEEAADEILALDAALNRLETLNPRGSRVIECRFFVGLSIEETAAVLDLSPATVKRSWTTARTWLYQAMRPDA